MLFTTLGSLDSVLYQQSCLFIRLQIIIILISLFASIFIKRNAQTSCLPPAIRTVADDADEGAKAAGGIQLRDMRKAIESMLLMVSNIL